MNNKELENYYGNFLELFLLPGWKQLQEQLRQTAESLNDVSTIRDQRDLDFRQGQLKTITTLLAFQVTVEQTLTSIETEDAVDAV